MKASLAVARQTQAAESVAENVSHMQEQLDRIEAMFNTLLESLAHDGAASVDTDTEPKRAAGRPKASK